MLGVSRNFMSRKEFSVFMTHKQINDKKFHYILLIVGGLLRIANMVWFLLHNFFAVFPDPDPDPDGKEKDCWWLARVIALFVSESVLTHFLPTITVLKMSTISRY
jgi:hypothetical protein